MAWAAARPRPGGRQRVGAVDEDRLERARLVVAVVALHGVNDLALLGEVIEHPLEMLHAVADVTRLVLHHIGVDRGGERVLRLVANLREGRERTADRHAGREAAVHIRAEHEVACGGGVMGEQGQSEAAHAAIGQRDGVIQVLVRHEGRHRPEGLDLVRRIEAGRCDSPSILV